MESSRKPEPAARADIDALLSAAGWIVQNYRAFNPTAGGGIALREVPLKTGPCGYEELTRRDKANLDIFWLKDEVLDDSANLPAPGFIGADIVADLEAALEQFSEIESDLKE